MSAPLPPPAPTGALVVVAGATGHLGRHVVRALAARGHRVRALTRSTTRAAWLLGAGRPGAIEVVAADLTRAGDAAALEQACAGAAAVFSCAGAPVDVGAASLRDRRGFEQVDRDGNLRLRDAAERAGAGRFVYVSLHGGRALRHTAYAAAHEAVVDALAAGRLPWVVVRPTGFFSFFDEVLRQALAGRGLVIGDGRARTNPIHEADLAEPCADVVTGPSAIGREVDVGGPVTYTRREITELALAAAGRPPRVRQVPPGLFRAAAAIVRPLQPRVAALLDFGAAVAVTDAVAPAHGTHDLATYFAARVRELRG